MWIAVMSTLWCVTCATSSTSPHACWNATTSSVPAVYVAGPLTVVSAAPSVGKRLHCGADQEQYTLAILKAMKESVIYGQRKHMFFSPQ